MKNKTILLGILAIFIIIILFYGSFYSWKEGACDPIDEVIDNFSALPTGIA
jgi:hypothetical protein